jgi:hypothetical protein
MTQKPLPMHLDVSALPDDIIDDIIDKVMLNDDGSADANVMKTLLQANKTMSNKVVGNVASSTLVFNKFDNVIFVFTYIIMHFIKSQNKEILRLLKKHIKIKSIKIIVDLIVAPVSFKITLLYKSSVTECIVQMKNPNNEMFIFRCQFKELQKVDEIYKPYLYMIMSNGYTHPDSYAFFIRQQQGASINTVNDVIHAMIQHNMRTPNHPLVIEEDLASLISGKFILSINKDVSYSNLQSKITQYIMKNFKQTRSLLHDRKEFDEFIKFIKVPSTSAFETRITTARPRPILSVPAVFVIPEEISSETNIDVLNSTNAEYMRQYASETGKPSIYLMRFYNQYLEVDEDEEYEEAETPVLPHLKQQRIRQTLEQWRKVKFIQPHFTTALDYHIAIDIFNPRDITDIDLQYKGDYGILVPEYIEFDFNTSIKQEIITWLGHIESGKVPADYETSGFPPNAFQFFPLLPLAEPANALGGGRKSNTNIYQKTKKRVIYKKKKYFVYTGKRGGEYIFINDTYVALYKLVKR